MSQLSQNSLLARWKSFLDSDEHGKHKIALMEIAEVVSEVKSEKSRGIELAIINSDAFHFISRLMSYQQRSVLLLINKIVCHLSRIPQFYEHDIFRVLRGYANVINSFPTKAVLCDKDQEYHKHIFFSLNFIIKRGFEHKCNFSNREMPLDCFISNVASLQEAHFCNPTALETMSLTIRLMTAAPCVEPSKFRDEKVLAMAVKLNMQRIHLESVAYSIFYTEILKNIISYVPEKEKHTSDHELIKQEVVDKFLSLVDFVSLHKIKIEHFELFCVLMYFLLVSEKLSERNKMQLVSRLFSLKGHWKLVSMLQGETEKSKLPLRSKVQLLLSHVLFVYLKFISEFFGVAEVTSKSCFQIVTGTNLCHLSPHRGDQKFENTLMFIFMTFIDFRFKKSKFAPGQVLSSMAFVLATMKSPIPAPFQILLTKMFTASYKNVQIDGNFLLPVASVELQKLPKSQKAIDLHFLRWWKVAGNPSDEVFNKAVMDYLSLCDSSQIIHLQSDHLTIFNRKLVLEAFLKNPTIEMHNKLSFVLCQLPEQSQQEFHSLIKELRKLLEGNSPLKIINVLSVLNSYNGNSSALVEKFAASVMLDFMKKSNDLAIDLKILAIEFTTKLLCLETE